MTAKRAMDVVAAAAGLLVLSPLLAAVALGIRVTMGSPVLFRQPRAGRHGRPFTLAKFRTMRPPRPGEDPWRSDADRLNALGRFLRSSSLDELPTLWNVLRGDMSLVGPRPLLLSYVERYTPEQRRRLEVLPGITGWAQVNGRQNLRFSERIVLDVWYVDHRSLALDLRILLRTVTQVFRSHGVQNGQRVDDVDDLAPAPHPADS